MISIYNCADKFICILCYIIYAMSSQVYIKFVRMGARFNAEQKGEYSDIQGGFIY